MVVMSASGVIYYYIFLTNFYPTRTCKNLTGQIKHSSCMPYDEFIRLRAEQHRSFLGRCESQKQVI